MTISHVCDFIGSYPYPDESPPAGIDWEPESLIYPFVEGKVGRNAVKENREKVLMSKAELARKAGVSPLTIDRVESGKNCRMETMRKIILALGRDLSDKNEIFPED